MNLENKVGIITGGSSGIGLEVAKNILSRGAEVYSLDIQEPIESVDGLVHIMCDITDSKSVKSAIGQIDESVDILINNAGTIRRGTIFESTEDDYQIQFDVNIKGSWLVLKYSESILKADATVIQIASRHGINPKIEPGLYSITKKAVISLADVLRLTKPEYNVKIVSPGRVDTPMLCIGRSEKECVEARKTSNTPEFIAEKIIELIESDYNNLFYNESIGEYQFL